MILRYHGLWIRNESDRQIIDECTWHYNPGFEAISGEPSLMIDIGAHIGGFIAEAKRRYSHVRIIAVEPETANYELACKNVGDLPGVDLWHGCVGYGEPPLWLELDIHNTGNARVMNQRPDHHYGHWVRNIFTLDELITEPVDLLKIDCEGAEYNIIKNASQATWRRVRAIVGEYHGSRTEFYMRALPFLQAHFEISFYPPYNQHVGFFLGVSRYAD